MKLTAKNLAATSVRSALAGLGLLAFVAGADAFQLVTEQEAALPRDEASPLSMRGGPTRRPDVVLITPAPRAGMVKSPMQIRIRFDAFGGGKIDVDSIVVTYKRLPSIDVTQRLQPYITAAGIDIPGVEIPPGTHEFRVDLKDKDGRVGRSEFTIRVAP